jgi:hypothetical protein
MEPNSMRRRTRLTTGWLVQLALAAAVASVSVVVSASAPAPPPRLDVTLAAGWDGVQDAGWVPYVVTVSNRGDADFAGTVRLVPDWRSAGISLPWPPPAYRSPVAVAGHTGGQRVVFYVRGERYYADVLDRAGREVRRARLTPRAADPAAPAAYTVGLAGTDASETQVRSLSDLARIGVFRFPRPADVPANPVVLGNLAVVLLAGLDAGALTSGQVTALRRYVELGGTLAVTGGSAWRSALAPLPAALTPLRPQADGDAPLGSLAALAGRVTAAHAPVATGTLLAGRVVLDADDGTPLVVDAPLGAGHVVELTFDPADLAPADPALAQLGWAQAVFRAEGSLGLFGQGGGQRLPSGFGYAGPVDATWMLPLLERLGAVPVPPSAPLLAALLLGPALLVGLVAGALALRLRRPSRFWAAPLLLALVAPPVLALGGAALRSGDLVDSEVQVLLPAPGGQALSISSHAILASAPGDYRLRLLPGSLVGRLDYSIRPLDPPLLPDALWQALPPAALAFGAWRGPGPQVVVSGVGSPELDLLGVGTGPVLSLETASLHAVDLTLESHLSLGGGRLRGTVANRGTRTLRAVRLYGGSANPGQAERALLGLDLPPGGVATVDAPLVSYVPGAVQPIVDTGTGLTGPPGDAVAELAAARVIQRPGDFVLVGLTDPLPEVGAGAPVRVRGLAAVVSRVALAAADRFPGRWSSARPVSLAGGSGGMVDVYELEGPATAHPDLALTYQGSPVGLSPSSLEVYDWSSRSWRGVPVGTGAVSVGLAPSERRDGLVRVRVHESTPLSADWDLRLGD